MNLDRPHYKLNAWREAIALVKEVYRITKRFPREELYALTSQLRRAAISVPSNLAEGAARSGSKEFSRFLDIAKGSLSELETQLIIAVELGYLTEDAEVFDLVQRVAGLIGGLQNKLPY